MANRDEFSEKTKTLLAKRVGYFCSRPDCQKHTIGANSDPNKFSNIGVASHITAAAENGPRYNINLSPEERSHIDNGIWLCFTCSKLIDTDLILYSESVLRKWKIDAEKESLNRVNSKLKTEHEIRVKKIPKKKYPSNLDHIERSVITYIEHQKKKDEFIWQYSREEKKQTLISLFEETFKDEGKRIVLLSVAGFGKTEELDNVAAYFSNDEQLIYPIRKSLKNYEGETIEDLLTAFEPQWREIPTQSLLLLLDGLDEIKEQFASSFKSKLNSFIENNPLCNVLVTSRFNFYDIKLEHLTGFDVHILQPLTQIDITNYIDKNLGFKTLQFNQKLREQKFTEYNNNPYYLTRLVRFYNNDPASFPQNKSDLFTKILFDRIDNDEGRFNKENLKETLLPSAKKVAFCMTLSGKSSLTNDELQTVIPERETREELKRFCVFNQNESALDTWSFEHNNVREYLCALQLREFTFERIKDIITYSFNRDKLLPRFLNTISFLFEIIDNKSQLFLELFEWLLSTQSELFVRFEKEQIEKEKRSAIFKGVFENYKQLQIPLYTSPNFYIAELASFVEIDLPIIDFLEKEINNNCTNLTAYDSLQLLSECKKPYVFKERLIELYFFILESDEFAVDVKAKCIKVLEPLAKKEKSIFEKIINTEKVDVKNHFIRNQLDYILAEASYFEDYCDFILESITISEEARKRDSYIHGNDRFIQLILKFKNAKSIKRVLQYCVVHKKVFSINGYHSGFHLKLEDAQALLETAKKLAIVEKSIIRLVYRIFISTEVVLYDDKLLPFFKDFFIATCDITAAFKRLYPKEKKYGHLLHFANEECVDFLIEQYKKGLLSESDLLITRNKLSWQNKTMSDYFLPKFNLITENRFKEDIDYQKIYDESFEKNQLILLKQDLFLEEAELIFQAIPKERVEYMDLYEDANKKLVYYQHSKVKNEISSQSLHTADKTISKTEFINLFFDKIEWENFSLSEIAAHLENGNKERLIPELLQFAKDWLVAAMKNTITDPTDGRWHYFYNVEFIKRLFLLIEIEIEDIYLLNLLEWDYSGFYHHSKEIILSSRIINMIENKAFLKERVLENIHSSNIDRLVLLSHFKICNDLLFQECIPELYQVITSDTLFANSEKKTLTDYFLNLGGDITDFDSYLTKPEFEREEDHYSSWKWYLLEKFKDLQSKKVAKILLEIFNDSLQGNNGKIEVIKRLLEMGRKEGLELWTKYIKENHILPFDHDMKPINSCVTVNPNQETADLLLDTLNYSFENKIFHNRSYQSIQECIYSTLILLSIGVNARENYTYIKNKIEQLILVYKSEEFVSRIIIFSQNLNSQFYQNHSYEISILDSVKCYKDLTN